MIVLDHLEQVIIIGLSFKDDIKNAVTWQQKLIFAT